MPRSSKTRSGAITLTLGVLAVMVLVYLMNQ